MTLVNVLAHFLRLRPKGRGIYPQRLNCLTSLPIAPQETFTVCHPIYGIKVNRFRRIHEFSFRKRQNILKDIDSDQLALFLQDMTSNYFISIKISSMSYERAIEIAQEKFMIVEHLFTFLIGAKRSGYEVRVFSPTLMNSHQYICSSSQANYYWGSSIKNSYYRDVDLNSHIFTDSLVRMLFKIAGNMNFTSLEERISKAIIWIGRGIKSLNSSQSIVCYTSALESLLIQDEEIIITPSISASLSEQCAFLLSDKYEDRIKIVTYVKKIYKERSAAAHGNKTSGSNDIEELALELSRRLTFEFVELYQKGISNESQIGEIIQKRKYGKK